MKKTATYLTLLLFILLSCAKYGKRIRAKKEMQTTKLIIK